MPPTSSMTRAQIRKRVALRAKLLRQDEDKGTIEAVNTEPGLTKLNDAIDDGVGAFTRANNWSFLSQRFTLTLSPDGSGPLNINKDPTRYLCPDLVESIPQLPALWKGPNNEPGGRLKLRPMEVVQDRSYYEPETMGAPEIMAGEFNSLLSPNMSRPGAVEVAVWPIPDQAYITCFRGKLGPIKFTDDNQVGFWPAVHDLTVIDFCVDELFKHDLDHGDPVQARKAAQAHALLYDASGEPAGSLKRSIDRDNEDFRPQELGSDHEDVWPRAKTIELTDIPSGQVLLRTTVFT